MATTDAASTTTAATNTDGLPAEIPSALEPPERKKMDQISALQDGIDSLSLSMFEALRGLRDAVAPESGNLGGQANNNNTSGGNNNNNNETTSENDFEDFIQAYKDKDPVVLEKIQKYSTTSPKKQSDFAKIHARIEMEKDAELVKKLAQDVLQKSADIDRRVSALPGMERTRTEQMKLIETLLEQNREATEQLEETYKVAEQRREQVRTFVRDHTCEALGILED